MMSPFEITANNIVTVIQAAPYRIKNFGYPDAADEAVSAVNASFVTWLTACAEAMAQTRTKKPRADFCTDIIDKLKDDDDPNWPSFIQPAPASSLRRRLESMWGIRVAFTHSDGDITGITVPRNLTFATDAPKYLKGVSLIGDRLDVSKCDLHTAIRSIVQVRCVLQLG